MATASRLSGYIFDSLLELEDGAAAITADGAGSAILDLGAGRVVGDIVIDVSAMDLTTGDEQYNIIAEVSDSATFASGIEQACAIQIGGATTPLGNRDLASDVGRYVLSFQNQLNDRVYRYLQLHVDVGGTTPSITFKAYLSKGKGQGGDA